MEAPRVVSTVANETDAVILVDHNEKHQSVDDLDEVKVVEVIDHHRIANFETADPLYFRAEPVGCTATILLKLFKEHHVEVSKLNAGLMLSAIISDTLLLKSPTCTDEDVAAAKELSDIANLDMDTYGLDMLKAGTDLGDKTVAELLAMDAKEFTMGTAKVEIAQINAVDVESIYKNQSEIEAGIQSIINDKGLDLFP